jgi:anthranilate 1,2-dioxygenase large subunit/terephthalate 1,2-dioxygenase oxygenase component alpha subunit
MTLANDDRKVGERRWSDPGLTRVPYWLYRDPEVYAAERARLFMGRTWNFVALDCEVPSPGDYRTSFVGDVPVIVVRGPDGQVRVLENRCAHRGAQVCLQRSGNAKRLTCVYHAWSYDLDGSLVGVAFRNGVKGAGGMPASFDPGQHGLRRLNVEVYHGLVFASFAADLAPVEQTLGPVIAERVKRVFNRPVKLLGQVTQSLPNNWKLYIENVKDSYHASILHTFFTTFKINRLSQAGGILVDDSGGHHVSYSKLERAEDDADYDAARLRSENPGLRLQDASLLAGRDEWGDGVTLQILTVFPNFVIQQIQNSLAVRQVLPRGIDRCDVNWTLFGYADEPAELTNLRVTQSNLVGPAGFISMEDGCVGGFVQRSIAGSEDCDSVVMMGGEGAESQETRATETSVRGFWKAYRAAMDL